MFVKHNKSLKKVVKEWFEIANKGKIDESIKL